MPRPWWGALLIATAMAWIVLPDHPRDAGGAASGEWSGSSPISRDDRAAELFARARELRLAVLAASGRERERGLAGALAALRTVRLECPEARDLGALAAFRAGELLRSSGFELAALVEFRAAQGGDSQIARRARLEIAHIQRRAGRLLEALESYLDVCPERDVREAYCDRAELWAGRVAQRLGRPDEALRRWRMVAESAFDPLQRIAAFDERILEHVARGDLEAAAGVLQECRRSVTPVGAEASRLGEQVRSALESMRGIERLKAAVAERRERRRDEASQER